MMKKLICLMIIVFSLGCGGYLDSSRQAGKDIAEQIGIDSPLKEANKREALIRAKEDVDRSRRAYERCLRDNNNDEAACTTEKRNYEESTERYIEIQQL